MGSTSVSPPNPARPTLHRLMWSSTEESRDLIDWRISPGTTPPEGLPIRVAIAMLQAAIAAEVKRKGKRKSFEPPIWLLPSKSLDCLAWGRRYQLGKREHPFKEFGISKSLIEAHNGEIGVRSRPGEGSTFWFTLPLSREASTPSDSAARKLSPG